MKVTKDILSEIINEEINLMIESGEIDEGVLDRLKARAAGLGTKLKGGAQSLGQAAAGKIAGAAGAGDLAGKLAQSAVDTKSDAAKAALKAQAASLLQKKANQINRLATSLRSDVNKMGLQHLLDDSIVAIEEAVEFLMDDLKSKESEIIYHPRTK